MTDIKLNPRKLLGFKVVANGGSADVLHSPKIGGKGCQTINADATRVADTPAATRI